jgi:hypothetical protein
MKDITSEPITSELNQDGGTENRSYLRSQSDRHIPMNRKHLPRTISAAASTFPRFYEQPIDVITAGTTEIPFPSPPAALSLSTVHNHPSHRRAIVSESFERQSSLPDPMSDRVSTILVWQNLTVSTRGDQRKGFLQRVKLSKNSVPQKKSLLHNVSGAITGGLWAVMGKFSALK